MIAQLDKIADRDGAVAVDIARNNDAAGCKFCRRSVVIIQDHNEIAGTHRCVRPLRRAGSVRHGERAAGKTERRGECGECRAGRNARNTAVRAECVWSRDRNGCFRTAAVDGDRVHFGRSRLRRYGERDRIHTNRKHIFARAGDFCRGAQRCGRHRDALGIVRHDHRILTHIAGEIRRDRPRAERERGKLRIRRTVARRSGHGGRRHIPVDRDTEYERRRAHSQRWSSINRRVASFMGYVLCYC